MLPGTFNNKCSCQFSIVSHLLTPWPMFPFLCHSFLCFIFCVKFVSFLLCFDFSDHLPTHTNANACPWFLSTIECTTASKLSLPSSTRGQTAWSYPRLLTWNRLHLDRFLYSSIFCSSLNHWWICNQDNEKSSTKFV